MPNDMVSRAVLRAAMVEFGTKAGRCTGVDLRGLLGWVELRDLSGAQGRTPFFP